METLASRLAEARKNAGMTQAEVALKLFVTTQSVSSWECGNSIPDTEKLPGLAALYNVTTDWLLSGKKPSEKILEVTANLSDRLFSETRMATWRLLALPLPHTACLMRLGAYSYIVMLFSARVEMTAPRAEPSIIAVRTFSK